jgi:tetratricopeptide (TPR) repeat protein
LFAEATNVGLINCPLAIADDAVSVPQLNITGAYESAQLAYIEAIKRNPKNPGILMLLARLSATRNDLKQAEAYAQQAIQIKNNYLEQMMP